VNGEHVASPFYCGIGYINADSAHKAPHASLTRSPSVYRGEWAADIGHDGDYVVTLSDGVGAGRRAVHPALGAASSGGVAPEEHRRRMSKG
jgi:hypothetical protein